MTVYYRVNKYILTNVIYFYFIQPFDNDTIHCCRGAEYHIYMYTGRYHGAHYCTRALVTITQNISD